MIYLSGMTLCMPKPNRLTDKLWDMQPSQVEIFDTPTPTLLTLRVTASRIGKADPERVYTVKKTPKGIAVARLS